MQERIRGLSIAVSKLFGRSSWANPPSSLEEYSETACWETPPPLSFRPRTPSECLEPYLLISSRSGATSPARNRNTNVRFPKVRGLTQESKSSKTQIHLFSRRVLRKAPWIGGQRRTKLSKTTKGLESMAGTGGWLLSAFPVWSTKLLLRNLYKLIPRIGSLKRERWNIHWHTIQRCWKQGQKPRTKHWKSSKSYCWEHKWTGHGAMQSNLQTRNSSTARSNHQRIHSLLWKSGIGAWQSVGSLPYSEHKHISLEGRFNNHHHTKEGADWMRYWELESLAGGSATWLLDKHKDGTMTPNPYELGEGKGS